MRTKKEQEEFNEIVIEFIRTQTELNDIFFGLLKKVEEHLLLDNCDTSIIDLVDNMEKSSKMIDEILDKINKNGIDSLTEEEKNILKNG